MKWICITVTVVDDDKILVRVKIVFVEILDDLGDHVDRTDARVRSETQNVTVIDNKDKTCIYWVVIILLFISIIIVVAI